MAIYVCFDDSNRDPTYSFADSAYLVDSDHDPSSGNPCSPERVNKAVSVMPNNSFEVKAFAAILGWNVDTDSEGQIILRTGIKK